MYSVWESKNSEWEDENIKILTGIHFTFKDHKLKNSKKLSFYYTLFKPYIGSCIHYD
jgi:hypothetical protein